MVRIQASMRTQREGDDGSSQTVALPLLIEGRDQVRVQDVEAMRKRDWEDVFNGCCSGSASSWNCPTPSGWTLTDTRTSASIAAHVHVRCTCCGVVDGQGTSPRAEGPHRCSEYGRIPVMLWTIQQEKSAAAGAPVRTPRRVRLPHHPASSPPAEAGGPGERPELPAAFDALPARHGEHPVDPRLSVRPRLANGG